MVKAKKEQGREVVEEFTLLGVNFRDETDGPLHERDCFIKINNVAKTVEPKEEGTSEIIEILRPGLVLI